jgi:hypothetical protein
MAPPSPNAGPRQARAPAGGTVSVWLRGCHLPVYAATDRRWTNCALIQGLASQRFSQDRHRPESRRSAAESPSCRGGGHLSRCCAGFGGVPGAGPPADHHKRRLPFRTPAVHESNLFRLPSTSLCRCMAARPLVIAGGPHTANVLVTSPTGCLAQHSREHKPGPGGEQAGIP